MASSLKLAGVMGWPVAHSLSPKLHNRWLHQYKINGEYRALAVREEEVAAQFAELPAKGFVGWNITLPHKEKALTLVDEPDAAAQAIGAVNTVVVQDGKLIGMNTDAAGFYNNLRVKAPARGNRALILGAGGAAKAVAYALAQFAHYKEIHIANRTFTRAEQLAKQHSVARAVAWEDSEKLLPDIDLLVNTTTLGMQGQPPLTLSLQKMNPKAVVTDIVYRPLETPLLREAKRYKLHTVNGLGMLIYQAVPAFEAWFGVRPEVTPELESWLLS
jgi:shikimate dehydrogenase